MVLLPFLLAAVGVMIDHGRLQGHRDKLQTISDLAVLIASQEAHDWKSRDVVASKFVSANLPDADLKTRTVLNDGEIVFQVMSVFETPLLGMISHPRQTVYVSTAMPKGAYDSSGELITTRYSRKQLRKIRQSMDRMIREAPAEYREHFRKEYERYYERLRKQSKL